MFNLKGIKMKKGYIQTALFAHQLGTIIVYTHMLETC